MRDGDARERDGDADVKDQRTDEHDAQHAKARDQRAGEERRPEHADDVPAYDHRRITKRMPAKPHREGRRNHQQVHHAVTDGGGGHRHKKRRLHGDLAHRPDRSGQFCLARRWNVQPAQQHDHHDEEKNQRQVGTHILRREEVDRALTELRPDNAPDQAPRENQRNRPRLEIVLASVGGGKAVILPEGGIDTEQRPQYPGERTDGETGAASEAAHQHRSGYGAQRRPHHPAGHRQRGEGLVRRKRVSGEAVERDDGGVVGEQQRLAGGEQRDVLLGGVHAFRGHCGRGKAAAAVWLRQIIEGESVLRP